MKTHSFLRGANKVSIGDEVLVDRDGEVIPDKVIDVSSSRMKGDYNLSLKSLLPSLQFCNLIFVIELSTI